MQDLKDHEIIIATEFNANKLIKFCKLLYIDCIVMETEYWNRCWTGNLAIIRSRGEPVVLLEDDVELEPHWFSKVVKHINAGEDVGCVYFTVLNLLGSESIATKSNKRILRFIMNKDGFEGDRCNTSWC